MIIYSESFHVEHSVEAEWKQWVKDILIPEMYKTETFSKVIFSKVVSHSDETGLTYSIQYYTKGKNELEDFYRTHSERLSQLLLNQFGTRVLSFKTELELIEVFEL